MIKKFTLSFSLLLFAVGFLHAQLLTTNPAFPTASDSVIITFNAALGDAGLKGFTGDVYAHTGVITDKSTSGSDWKYVIAGWTQNIPACKMARVGTDLYQLRITPSIRDYYGVPTNEQIQKLAFVFRSADQSKTGRMPDGSDIFYEVYSVGLNVNITTPNNSPDIVALNDTIHVAWNSSHADSTFLYLDNVRQFADTGSVFSMNILASTYGKHWLVAKADSNSVVAYDSTSFYVRRPNEMAALPVGIKDGINYINDSTVTLCLYAPHKNNVFAIGGFNNWEIGDQWLMKETPDSSRYWLTISGLTPKKQYVFQYLIDGSIRIGDPYADQVSDPWNDQYISSATYPNLIAYPKGKTTGIATVLQTAQTPYSWKVTDFTPPKKENLVIYELWVSDFVKGHTFNDLTDSLNYLKRLGVNAIELMPVNEFEGNISWGYNPNYYFAVDKYYGPKDTYKAFIDACHANGIAVIMDIVLNHSYNTSPFAMMYWNAAKNRPAANNPWFNEVSPNSSYSWGNDFNYDSPQTVRFVDSVTNYWLAQYKIDGYRFDFAKGFTNTAGDGGAYDQYRINHLEHIYDHIHSAFPKAYDILELFTANSEEKVLTSYGMSVWGNSNYNYNQATMGFASGSNFSGISYKQNGFTNQGALVGYMESHDEERLMYKNETYGNSSGSYNVKDIPTGLKRMEQAGAFFFTIPGPKMIWQFGELGYDYSINRCEDGSNSSNCRTALKPIRWDYYNDLNRKHLYGVWAALIKLKETQAVFQTTDYTLSLAGVVKTIHLNSSDMDVAIVGNFDVKPQSTSLSFQKNGTWYEYFSGDSLSVTNNAASLNLQPGEYRLYTNKRLQKPDFILGVKENKPAVVDEYSLQVYPNPVSSTFDIKLNLSTSQTGEISLFDLTGRKVRTFYSGKFHQGLNTMNFDASGLNRGLYLLVAETGGQRQVTKLIVK